MLYVTFAIAGLNQAILPYVCIIRQTWQFVSNNYAA